MFEKKWWVLLGVIAFILLFWFSGAWYWNWSAIFGISFQTGLAIILIVAAMYAINSYQPRKHRNKTERLEMPRTTTPIYIFVVLGVLVMAFYFLVNSFFQLIMGWSWYWGAFTLIFTLSFTTDYYLETVDGFKAKILLDGVFGRQRAIFQGWHLKLPWENESRKELDLRVEIKEVREETYTTNNGRMNVKYVIVTRPNYDTDDPSTEIILFSSYEDDAIKTQARAQAGQVLSDYYGKHNNEELKDKKKITEEAIRPGYEEPDGVFTTFQKTHGAIIKVVLEDSDYDEETQKALDTVSKAVSFGRAVKKLVDEGMDRAEAEKVAKMMNLPGVEEYIISFDATGVDNLRDVTIMPFGGKGGKK